ncbi:hypothetical protein GALMADRAFT_254598 [Galerina marginata CBS 339.88]|uniref:Granulins domain-containing protein n=1 Tax=Galerina marginata (strain CBS 339.88) TaxID=685588 RepID=A0A067SJC9_GALM3|nr:hypothetical protein GALMADRAFT_254598 [Galerina marginata CBS 339.88]
MRFSTISFTASLALFSGAYATPTPQGGTTVYHCDGFDGLICPTGYHCCGPILEGLGGTCRPGISGACPF